MKRIPAFTRTESAQRYADLKFLSDASVFLLKNSSAAELFGFVADKLAFITQGVILVSEYDPLTNQTEIRALKLLPAEQTTIERILGRSLNGLSLQFDEKTRDKFISGKLADVKGGLYELSFYRLPKPLCLMIEKSLHVRSVHAMAFVTERDFLGTVAIITRGETGLRNRDLVEAFINQCAVALKRIKTEQQLVETNDKLEAERDRLKYLERLKDEFIGIASHELKTPLSSLKAYNQIICRYVIKNDYSKIADLNKRMERQLNTIQDYINDLLDVNKIQAGKLILRMETFDVYDLLTEQVDSLREILPAYDIRLRPFHQRILADRERLGQVLTNLITNAAKYSCDSREIHVEAGREGQSLVISVRDSGIGISPDQQQKIFDRFYQVRINNAKTAGGLGLGLYICKGIIERHGGRIQVASQIGRGSTFSFSIPVIPEKTKAG